MTDTGKITAIIENYIKGSDTFIVEVKVSSSKIAVSVDKPAGITIEECVALSRHLNSELEPTGLLQTHELEVGSPGMDEPLRVYRQYLRRIGRQVRVMLPDGKEHKGLIKEADENGFTLTVTNKIKQGKKRIEEKADHTFSYADVKEVKLIISF